MIDTGMFILSASVSLLIGSTALMSDEWSQYAAITLAGSLMASAMSFMLADKHETNKVIIGRALFAMLIGVSGSRFVWWKFEIAKELAQDPLLTLGGGCAFGLIGYASAQAIVKITMERSPSAVRKQAKRLERMISGEDTVVLRYVSAAGEDDQPKTKRRNQP